MRRYLASFLLIALFSLVVVGATETKEKGFPFTFDMPEKDNDGKTCDDPSTLDVTGVGQLSVRTDVIRIGVEISTTNANSAGTALSQNNAKVNSIQAFLTSTAKGGLGLDNTQISTISFSVNPVYTYSTTGEATLVGFKATQVIEITVNDISLAAKIIDALADDTNILYVNFDISESVIKANRETLIKNAIKDAKNKAHIAARKTHYKITGIKDIRVSDSVGVTLMKTNAAVAVGTNLIGNSQTITTSVEIVYSIEKNEQKKIIKKH